VGPHANARAFHDAFVCAGLGAVPVAAALSAQDRQFLRIDVARSIYRSLGCARSHDEIIALGRLAEGAHALALSGLPADAPCPQPIAAGTMALANMLREAAVTPSLFLTALCHMAQSPSDGDWWLPLEREHLRYAGRYLSHLDVGAGWIDEASTFLLCLNEACRQPTSRAASATPDFFLF